MDRHVARLLTSNKIIGLAYNWSTSTTPISSPVLFQKAVSSVIPSGSVIKIPGSEILLHEIELAFYISKKASNIAASDAYSYIEGYCLALDMTSPSLLAESKKHGLGWDIGKGYDTFCPLSSFVPYSALPDPHQASLELRVNNEVKQKGDLVNLKHKVPFIIEYITSIFTLNPGDLILTGTMPGSSQVKSGDQLHGKLCLKDSVLVDLLASVA